MDKGTLFLALIILVVAAGIGFGVWQYYTDAVPAQVLESAPSGDGVKVVVETPGALQAASAASAGATSVRVFFANAKLAPADACASVFSVTRTIPQTTAVARAALTELLRGVTSGESANGYVSDIAPGTELRSLNLEGGVLRADFSKSLMDGVNDACRATAIRAQIESTAKQFPTVKEVVLSVEGKTLEQ